MSRVLVIGCGGVASVAIHKICQVSEVFSDLCIASRTVSKCDKLADELKGKTSTNITTAKVDADNTDEVIALINEFKPDVVLNVALPYQDLTIMDACLACKVPYVDTANYECEDTDNPEWRKVYEERCKRLGFTAYFDYSWQWAYREKYKEAGITALLGTGFDPGVTSVFTAYAQKHYVTIIPEIEMPSHSEEVLTAYPELSCTHVPYKQSDFCIGNEKTFEFLENVLTEVMELFPSEYIHIGGDEAGKASWPNCKLCQARMKKEGLKDVNELQSYSIHRMERFLNSHGRKLLGWDEILDGGLAPNATVMSWRGTEGGLAAIRSGHKAIMSPGQYCYLDGYQDAPYSQPEAIGGYLPLKKVYGYEPVPDSLSADEAKLMYGVQANLWTEYIPTEEHAEYMLYPRAIALAEVAWSKPENKSWEDFHRRALKIVDELKAKGYHPFELKNEIGNRKEAETPVEHLALGKKVTYNAPYWENYPAAGEATLTDGLRDGTTMTSFGRDL